MRSEPLVVYTTWYPGVEPYLEDWGRSVRAQTDSSFRLVVGVDRIAPEPWVSRLGLDAGTRCVIAPAGATPARVRQTALANVIDEVDAVVFVDSDDILEPSRVAAARASLATSDVVACSLRIADADGVETDLTFGPPPGTDPVADLPRHNVFGLSNSAYTSAVLRSCLPIPDACTLVDWLLATRAWAFGARLAFDATPRMIYRQRASGPTRVCPPFESRQVLEATDLVLGHYRVVLETVPELPVGPAVEIRAACDRVRHFRRAITDSAATLSRYVDALNSLPARSVWWWTVANEELEPLWMN